MPLVSIIVPVYKVEAYLERCIQSLCEQTLDNIEIILVDDGSPDKCPVICEEYAKKDKRIKVIHKLNGGLSSARNAGMDIARGKYIGFVDGDDAVEKSMYKVLFEYAEKYAVDFIMSDYFRIEGDGTKYLKTTSIRAGFYKKEEIRNVVYPQLIMGENLEYGALLSVWHCLYNLQFLKNNKLRFDERVRWSEDNIFSAFTGYCAEKFFYLKGKGLYQYYKNPGSITTSYRKGAWDVYCVMNEQLNKYFGQVKDYDFSYQLKIHMIFYACNCISQELDRPQKEAIKEIKRILHSEEMKVSFSKIKMPKVNRKLRLQLYLMKWKQTRILYFLRNKNKCTWESVECRRFR